MKRLCFFFLGFLCAFYSYDVVGANYYYSENTIIDENTVIDGDVYITNNVTIENYGTILGTIHVDTGYNLSIINHNIINTDFLSMGATVTQLICNSDDVHVINGLSNYIIKVQNANMLNMADLLSIAGYANQIQISDSSLIVEPDITGEIPIWLNNGVAFYVTGVTLQDSGVWLSNITGSAVPQPRDIDSMYTVTANIDSGQLVVQVTRETNYSIVFGGELGNYIDSLRLDNPRDKLVARLDMADTRSELKSVLRKSVRTNPILLSKPLKVINSLNDNRIFNNQDSVFSVTPFYIGSDEFNMYGGEIDLSGNVYKNVFAKLGIIGGTLKYDGKTDEYNSVIYGGNIDVEYMDADLYIGLTGLMSYSDFSDMTVFNDDKIVKGPNAIAGKFAIDSGKVFSIMNDAKFALFVGGVVDYAKVLSKLDTDFNLRVGIESGLNTTYDNNNYGFGLRAFVQTNGDIYTALYSNMLSVVDGVGGELNAGILYQDSIWSYKIGLDINFVF